MIHLRSIAYAPRPKRCDVRVNKAKQASIKSDLESDKIERRISAELVAKHNRGLERDRIYRQQGGE